MAQDSDKSKLPKPKSLKDAPPPPLPFAQHIKEGTKEEKRVKGKDDDVTVDEALKIVAEMKKAYEKIDRLISQALEATGWTPKYLKEFLDNPANFPNADAWREMQNKRKELSNSVKSPKELQEEEELAKKEAKKNPLLRDHMPHDPKVAKERRSKTVGQRRNWLPMR